jgi:predicted DsbA family dithiol-disulfide isomerase
LTTDVDIQVYSDVVCPWCYIGKRRLEAALQRFDGEATVTYKPFQLDPSTPTEGRPLLEWLGPKFGAAQAREMTAHTASIAAADGIEMHYHQAIIANTFDAHRLIWFANGGHSAGTGDSAGAEHSAGADHGADVAEALHRAHFTDGLDIGSRSVLTDIAAQVGLDPDAVRAFLDSDDGVAAVQSEIDVARELGITSVPTFVFAGKYVVSGAQDSELLLRTLEEVARRESSAVA